MTGDKRQRSAELAAIHGPPLLIDAQAVGHLLGGFDANTVRRWRDQGRIPQPIQNPPGDGKLLWTRKSIEEFAAAQASWEEAQRVREGEAPG